MCGSSHWQSHICFVATRLWIETLEGNGTLVRVWDHLLGIERSVRGPAEALTPYRVSVDAYQMHPPRTRCCDAGAIFLCIVLYRRVRDGVPMVDARRIRRDELRLLFPELSTRIDMATDAYAVHP